MLTEVGLRSWTCNIRFLRLLSAHIPTQASRGVFMKRWRRRQIVTETNRKTSRQVNKLGGFLVVREFRCELIRQLRRCLGVCTRFRITGNRAAKRDKSRRLTSFSHAPVGNLNAWAEQAFTRASDTSPSIVETASGSTDRLSDGTDLANSEV